MYIDYVNRLPAADNIENDKLDAEYFKRCLAEGHYFKGPIETPVMVGMNAETRESFETMLSHEMRRLAAPELTEFKKSEEPKEPQKPQKGPRGLRKFFRWPWRGRR